MRRGATYRLNLKVTSDLSGCEEIHLAFQNKKNVVLKTYPDSVSRIQNGDGSTTLQTFLTQEDTLSFKAGTPVLFQMRCRDEEDAYATPIYTLTDSIDDVIEQGVI